MNAETEQDAARDSRDVSLTIPARPDYLVLARLALSAVSRLTALSPEEVADLKLAITEAANEHVDDSRPAEDEGRLNFSFRLLDDRLVMELDGPEAPGEPSERELSRAIIEATVDECEFAATRTRLVKFLRESAE
ncbi:MAG TPA: ATP-binding protein [Thermoleophilaceae bacterium]|nr:ATP-binding protein [Thermoleophilaceae bacterium]